MDVAVCVEEKKLTEVCSVHLRVTIAFVFVACCDTARRKKNYGGPVLGNEVQEAEALCTEALKLP